MTTAPQEHGVAQDIQQQEQEQEKQTQDIETEVDHQEKENNASATTKKEEQKTPEEKKEENVLTVEKVTTPAKTATKKTPSQVSKSATKRKFNALHARNSAAEPSIHEHQKTKKARASELMKTPATVTNRGTTKMREFSFARPTESSARRTAALTEDQTHVKATPPSRKLQQLKRTPAKAQCASTPVLKTPTVTGAADKASRAHFSYTPYTGPLPPLTVESSFAPKNGQVSDRRAWSASPAQTKVTAIARKPRPASAKKTQLQSTTGKENNGVNTEEDAATNAASSSRTPVKPGKTGLPVSKEENCSASKEKDKAQRSLVQQARRTNPIPTTAEPTV